jgi:hypothetical protein
MSALYRKSLIQNQTIPREYTEHSRTKLTKHSLYDWTAHTGNKYIAVTYSCCLWSSHVHYNWHWMFTHCWRITQETHTPTSAKIILLGDSGMNVLYLFLSAAHKGHWRYKNSRQPQNTGWHNYRESLTLLKSNLKCMFIVLITVCYLQRLH